MSDQSKLGLGQIITTEQERDAIHVAVAPLIASEKLLPGAHIAMTENGRAYESDNGIAIVDPFLKTPVKDGQKFWAFIYPGTIKSLRHEWSHPSFMAENKIPIDHLKRVSEDWMRAWAKRHMGEDYYGDGQRSENDAYESAIRAGEDLHIGPYEDARDYIDNEWWSHWEMITGKTGSRGEYFSCGC